MRPLGTAAPGVSAVLLPFRHDRRGYFCPEFIGSAPTGENQTLDLRIVRDIRIGAREFQLGDALAAGAVLDYFNDFMDGLCTGFYTDADGFWDYGIDLSMKSFMQAKLLRAMLRFKP